MLAGKAKGGINRWLAKLSRATSSIWNRPAHQSGTPLSKESQKALEHLSPEQQSVILQTLTDLERLFERLNSLPWPACSTASTTQSTLHLANQSLWERVSLFHTTLSELDYLAIAIGLKEGRLPRLAQWSLQFHFDLFLGRPHEFAEQRRQAHYARVVESFEQASRLSDGHRVRLFATSEPLAQQYNSLGINAFEPLTYPINPDFTPKLTVPAASETSPCRITLAGGVRGEKGQRGLDPLCARIADTILAPRRGKLVVQRRRRSRFRKPQLQVSPANSGPDHSWIQYADHPLSEADYVDLVRSAGIGLLLYDGRTYYSRRAGVMGEFLASGVPCIVPAASWLSDQIEQGNRPHWKRLIDRGSELEPSLWNGSRMKLPLQQGESLQDQLLIVSAQLPKAGALEARHVAAASVGADGKVEGSPLGVYGIANDQLLACIPGRFLSDDSLAIEWQWAFEKQQPLQLIHPRAWLVPPTASGKVEPWGAIGWVVPDSEQVGPALDELLTHHGHYRQACLTHAPLWRQSHDPRGTVRQVMHVSESHQSRVA